MKSMTSLQKLMPRHYKIIDLAIAGTMNNKQIAETVGVTPVTVKNVLNMPGTQDIIAKRRHAKEAQIDELDVVTTENTVDLAR